MMILEHLGITDLFDAIIDELDKLYEIALELDAKDIDELVRECE